MKIDLSLLNTVRFETGESTALHVHTGHVDARDPLLVRPVIGPALHLKRGESDYEYPVTSGATPYGAGRSEMTAFQFGRMKGTIKQNNYLTTAGSDSPTLPPELKIEDELRLSAFLRPDSVPIPGGDMVLIAGVPGQFGLYQQHDTLVLRLYREGEPLPVDFACPTALAPEAWLLVEVQWSCVRNHGVPLWWLNGIRPEAVEPSESDAPLVDAGDRFNLAHDPTLPGAGDELLFWSGALRELEVSNEVVWAEEPEDLETTDELMHARAMKLFGLATGSTPLPRYVRPSVAWIRVGGVRHKVSWHHPRATDLGTLVEEARTNLCEDSDEPFDTDPLSIPVTAGRYTIWFEQKSEPAVVPAYLDVEAPAATGTSKHEVFEGEPLVVQALADGFLAIEKKGLGTVTFLQVERGVGPTSPIVTDGAPVTRAAETLAFRVTRSDIDFEQGRLDLEVTPQLDGPRGETGAVAQAGDILGMSLVRDEVVSADTAERPAALSGAGLWKARTTRSFHVEWQPGARLLWEDSLKLVAAADYSGAWPWAPGEEAAWLYLGGEGDGPRANAFFRNLVVDDRVPRFHADLHRFLYRQFGEGAFSEDESSVFRRWRRVEADGLALLARLGDRLKDQAFPDTTDLMLAVWEREIGLPAPWGLSEADRRALLAGLFRALGAADAEVEEQVARITGFAAVIERHREDVV